MSKKADRIITSVYLTKEMCGQIDKLADREHISRNEQIRRFIKKGLTVDGYTEDIDFIASRNLPPSTTSGISRRWWSSRQTGWQKC